MLVSFIRIIPLKKQQQTIVEALISLEAKLERRIQHRNNDFNLRVVGKIKRKVHIQSLCGITSQCVKIICLMKRLIKPTAFLFSQGRSNKKFVFLFGAPGVGKGTFSRLLQNDLRMLHLSTTGEIRKIIRGGTAKGVQLKLINQLRKVILAGGLITDDLIIELIREKAEIPEASNGLLLDGFPNNQLQLLQFVNHFTLDTALNIVLREDILLEKIKGRRVCIPCAKTYNLNQINRDEYYLEADRPKVEGKCDSCGRLLSVREDDTERVFRARLKEYHLKADPLLQKLYDMGKLLTFEPKRGLKDYPQMLSQVKAKLNLV